jgi:SAM-dependent methyltransferase
VAVEFIGWLDVPAGKRWLDVGCGTGALSRVILDRASPAALHGIDPSQSHIDFARGAISDSRSAWSVDTVETTRLPDGSFDVAVSGLVLNFIPDPGRALDEMKRLTGMGGIIAAYVWDYADKMELMRMFWDAAVALDHAVHELDEGNRFPLCNPERLEKLFAATGLRDVVVRPIDVPTRFGSFDDYWLPFLGGQGPAPGYAMSLTGEARTRLRERLHATLPIAADGSINLTARAWAIKGRGV